MAWQIRFETQAVKELSALDNSVKIKILKYLRKLEECDDPRVLGKSLTNNFSGYWRYRIGNYRIISRIYDTELVILLLAIRKRDVVYKIKQ
ncbi:MAG: type II toxin-antitoxin system mRNA interferase toxin, RelE/StbE family [Spirochaetae bacterium HGW-Spirochaetae-2]|jgi:mRNA interferase RelE/StbE|nr:MAG: type II toxin-antitoxin system mRNA interferase toxin, RelE/StbE family [Spirochaetae bacterium HGW-Spirochaetae-2]